MKRESEHKKLTRESSRQSEIYFRAMDPNSIVIGCDNCVYRQQDIDTYPCAKCHTRH
jgi:hypothetical protein